MWVRGGREKGVGRRVEMGVKEEGGGGRGMEEGRD